MASTTDQEEIPLVNLYLQIEYGGSDPHAVLGLSTNATDVEVKAAYRTIAIRLHPDKCQTEKDRLLHTRLFQSVQEAYQILQFQTSLDPRVQDARKALPENADALRVRNLDNREKLKEAREQAVTAKLREDALKAAAEAKDERLAEQRNARVAGAEAKHKILYQKAEAEARRRRKQMGHGLRKQNEGHIAAGNALAIPIAEDGDWDVQEDRLRLRETYLQEQARHDAWTENPFTRGHKPVRNIPTAKNATPKFDRAVDNPLVTKKEIEGRWNKQLLGGGNRGSASLVEQKQRMNNAAAKRLRREKLYIEAADMLDRPALKPGSGSTFCFAELEDALQSNYEDERFGVDQAVDRGLARLTEDTKSYLFLDGPERRTTTLLEDCLDEAKGCEHHS